MNSPGDGTPGRSTVGAESGEALPLPTVVGPQSELTESRPFSVGLAGYELLESVGRGGMGVVYRAIDLEMDREVAIKMLQDQFPSRSQIARRFVEEAKITGQLQHPGIPAVYRVGTLEDGRPFLAMKLIKGHTLDALVANGSHGLNLLAIFEAIAQAVGYAHAHQVIHRDLKPQNIMVGAFGEVQVMDWGLAKVLTSTPVADAPGSSAQTEIKSLRDPETEQTRAGSVMGTPAYMAPEQALGEVDQIDSRTDVFGLGGILCVLLTGSPPYRSRDGESVQQLAARANLDDAFARLDRSIAEPGLIHLAKRCLSPDPAGRPGDAQAVAKEVARLRQVIEERAKQAELDKATADVQIREGLKRRKVILRAGGILAAVLLLGIAGTTLGLFRARAARDRASERFTLALDAYNQMVFGIQEKLENRPGTLELRKDLLGNARGGLARLLKEAEKQGTPDLTLAVAHLRMGLVEFNLGDSLAARKEFDAGNKLIQRLADADPANTELQHYLGISFNQLGDVALQQGQTKAAGHFFQQALEVNQRVAEADPKNAESRRDLCASFSRMGEVMLQLGQTKEALDFFRKASALDQRHAEADPTNLQAQRDLSVGFNKQGDVALKLGQAKDALDFYRDGLKIAQQLADADPKNTEKQRDLGLSLSRVGNALLKLGQMKEALDSYQEGLKISQQLAEADPKNVEFQSDLSISFEKVGDVTFQFGEIAVAHKLFQNAMNIRQRQADADPNNAVAQRNLGFILIKLGNVARQLGQMKKAQEFYQKRLEISRKFAEAEPMNVQTQTDLFVAILKLGELAEIEEDFVAARVFYRSARQVLLPWHEKKLLVAPYTDAIPDVDQFIVRCQFIERAIADIEFIFTRASQEIPELLSFRAKALVKSKHLDEAIHTAARFATWAESQKNRDDHRYNAACAFALAATLDEKLIDRSLALLTQCREAGYFTPERVAHLRHDSDFDAIREHPKFVAFVETLQPEMLPAPRELK